MQRLSGKRAIITGGGSGIGRGAALRFAAEGATVLVVGRSPENIGETADLVRAQGGTAHHFVADVTVEADVAAMAIHALEVLGGWEIVFANAGTTDHDVPFFEQTVEAWEDCWRGNVISAFLTIKHMGPYLKQAGAGSIILMSSAGSLRANAGTIAYGAAKAAVNSLVMGAANFFAGTGVRGQRHCRGTGRDQADQVGVRLRPRQGRRAQDGRDYASAAHRHRRGDRGLGSFPRQRRCGIRHRADCGRRWRPEQHPSVRPRGALTRKS